MNKPLIFTAALMSAALMAGAAVDANKDCRVPPGGKAGRHLVGYLRRDSDRQRRPAETGLSSKKRQQDPGCRKPAAGNLSDCQS